MFYWILYLWCPCLFWTLLTNILKNTLKLLSKTFPNNIVKKYSKFSQIKVLLDSLSFDVITYSEHLFHGHHFSDNGNSNDIEASVSFEPSVS